MRDIELAQKPVSSYQTKAYGSPVNSFKTLFIYRDIKLKNKIFKKEDFVMSENKKSIDSLFEALMTAEAPDLAAPVGKYSMGIVNSKSNGRRLTLSKSIADKLKIDDELFAMPAEGENKLVITKTKVFPNSVKLTACGEGKKTIYCGPLVELLTKMFNLDFSKHVSQTYSNVSFEEFKNEQVAVISFS